MVSSAQSIRFQILELGTSARHVRAFRRTGKGFYAMLLISDVG